MKKLWILIQMNQYVVVIRISQNVAVTTVGLNIGQNRYLLAQVEKYNSPIIRRRRRFQHSDGRGKDVGQECGRAAAPSPSRSQSVRNADSPVAALFFIWDNGTGWLPP
jgi:hypothetical protein